MEKYDRKQVSDIEQLTEKQKQEIRQQNEEKKEYLSSYKKYKQKAKRLEEQLEELRLGEMSPCLVQSDMPGAHNQKDLSDYIVRRDGLIEKIVKARKAAIERFSEVQRQIEQMEDENEKTVLTLRYLRNYSWEKICIELDYSWRQIHYIHSRALEHFQYIRKIA